MNRLFIISIVAFALVACSSAQIKKENAVSMIDPAGNYEDCADVRQGQVIHYSFNTSIPVNFNLHYHAEKIYYPVEKNGVTSDSGTYEPDHEDIYCLMWTNPQNQAVSLKYNFVVETVSRPEYKGY